jgi:hypothetical protein
MGMERHHDVQKKGINRRFVLFRIKVRIGIGLRPDDRAKQAPEIAMNNGI